MQIVSAVAACALAAPAGDYATETRTTDGGEVVALAAPAAPVTTYATAVRAVDSGILSKVQQASEVGAYMFGYEALDGSFRMENRDPSGLVRGTYGYIDANGERQEFGTVSDIPPDNFRITCLIQLLKWGCAK